MQIVVIALAAIVGQWIIKPTATTATPNVTSPIATAVGVVALIVFFSLLAAALATPGELMSDFYRAGALVFGGGHVVLPMLQDFVARPRGFPIGRLLPGYGAAQALPGPLFTFSAYLGALLNPGAELLGGSVALLSIFLPGLLLVVGVFPFWTQLRKSRYAQSALAGVNAAVVGLLLAALVLLLWREGPGAPETFTIVVLAFLLLETWCVPPWIVVIGAAIFGAALSRLG
jgi:chromate transporter